MTSYATPPRIDLGDAETLFEPAGNGEGHWVGAPSVLRHAGTTYLGVRRRTPERRGHTVEIYERRGESRWTRTLELTADDLGVVSVERPCLVTDPRRGRLELFLPIDRDANDWSILKLDGVSDPAAFDPGTARPVLEPEPGSTDRETTKDPYVVTVGHRYYMYYAGHDGKTEQAHLATSTDGETWERSPENPVIPRGGWHDHHTRVSCVVPARDCPAWYVFYEGSGATDYGRTWNLRTGVAVSFDLETVADTSTDEPWLEGPMGTTGTAASRFATCRYLDVLDHGDRWDVFAEVARPDGSFALSYVTARVPG